MNMKFVKILLITFSLAYLGMLIFGVLLLVRPTYVLHATPTKNFIASVPVEQQGQILACIRGFAERNNYSISSTPRWRKYKVSYELQGTSTSLSFSNPFNDPKEFHIAVYMNPGSHVEEVFLARIYDEVRNCFIAAPGVTFAERH
jgi:hypothetical protein